MFSVTLIQSDRSTSSMFPTIRSSSRRSSFSPGVLARLATQALVDEAELTPKPGLVDLRGSGAHRDLCLSLLIRSAQTLEPHFLRMAETAQWSAVGVELREQLGVLGREAECAMLQVTGGVNTHRGAIWALGLLVAASAQQADVCSEEICGTAAILAALPDVHGVQQRTHGIEAARRYNVGGARAEAEAGFPHVQRIGLPALCAARRYGMIEAHARLHALMAIMTTLDDTCVLHRGGRPALNVTQSGAAHVLACGGVSTADGAVALDALHASLMRLWVSPGGSADMLAATLFLDNLSSRQESRR